MLNERKHSNCITNALRNFRDDSGSTTVEFVLWVPVFMVILGLTVDVSLLFLRQSNLWQVARDTARVYSTRQMTEIEAETYAVTNASFGTGTPVATVIHDNTTDYVQVVVTVPMVDVDLFGLLNFASDTDLVAVVTHRMEPL